MIKIDSKVCKKCNENKNLGEYYKKKDRKTAWCKACYKANKAIKKTYDMAYYEVNKERKKLYADINKERLSEYQRVYRAANKERVKLRNKAYRENKKDTLKKKKTIYNRERKKTDGFYLFKCRVRDNIAKAFKGRGRSKNSKVASIIGCSFECLQSHLIQTAIDNYGFWTEYHHYHIDHIIPLATAKTEDDVIKLNHYTNLQLLYPSDNLSKSDSLTWSLGNKD